MDRAEVSRRLKAGRWLAGGVDADGKPKQLSAADLAQRPPCVANKISANRIAEIEQLVVDARPMELEKIAECLGLPSLFASPELPDSQTPAENRAIQELADVVQRMSVELLQQRQMLQAWTDSRPAAGRGEGKTR